MLVVSRLAHLLVICENVTFSGVNGKCDGFESYTVFNPIHDREPITQYRSGLPVLTLKDSGKSGT